MSASRTAPHRVPSHTKAIYVVSPIAALAGIAVTWASAGNSILSIYVSIAVLFGLARVLDLPSASWWGARHVSSAKTAWGNRRLKHGFSPTDPIRKLSDVIGARAYFASVIFEENTRKLCTTYQDGLPMRIAGALLAALVFYWKNKTSGAPEVDDLSRGMNYFGAIAPALLALMWDYSRFERQRTWNRELQGP
jgi:hypothetical protein